MIKILRVRRKKIAQQRGFKDSRLPPSLPPSLPEMGREESKPMPNSSNTSVPSPSTESARGASTFPVLGFASFVGPNAFAKSSPTSISDSQSVFGKTSSVSTNPFAQGPFHTANPLIGASTTNGSQFGTSSVPAVGSAPSLGASTVPFFLLPSFGASVPALRTFPQPASTSVSDFQSVFGQMNNVSTNPFGCSTEGLPSAFPQSASTSMCDSQSVFGQMNSVSTNPLGCSTRGLPSDSSSSPLVGSAPSFGISTAPAYGLFSYSGAFPQSASTSMSDSQSVFGQMNSGSTNPFGCSTRALPSGSSSTPLVGSMPAFGISTTPSYGLFPYSGAFAQSASTTVSDSQSIFGQMNSVSTNPIGCSTGALPSGCSSAPSVGSVPSFGISTAPVSGLSSYSGGFPPFGQKSNFQVTSPSSESYPFGGTLQRTQFALGGKTSLPNTLSGSSNQLAHDLPVPQGSFLLVPQAPLLLVPQVNQVFGGQNTSQFGSSSTLAYITPSTCMFGLSSTPVYGDSRNTCASPIMPPFGVSSTPSFIFGYTPVIQVAFAFGGMPFITTPSPFGAQNPSLTLGQSGFEGQRSGSMSAAHASTNDYGMVQSISAMPAYSDKSHEELRWENHQFKVKGTHTLFPRFMVPRCGWEGSRVVAYIPKPVPSHAFAEDANAKLESISAIPPVPSRAFAEDANAKLESISAMPLYINKSHEELRWEHYQHGHGGTFSSTSASLFSTAVSASSLNPFGSNFSSTTPTLSALFTDAPVRRSSSSSCVNFASSTFSSSMSSITSQGTSEQLTSAPSVVMHPRPMTNPFGMLPALPRMVTDLRGSAPSVQNEESGTESGTTVKVKDLLQRLRELEASSQATLKSILSSFTPSGL